MKLRLISLLTTLLALLLFFLITSCKTLPTAQSSSIDTVAMVDRVTEFPVTPELKAAFDINPVIMLGDARIIRTSDTTAIKTDRIPVVAKHTRETASVPTKIKTVNKNKDIDKSKVKVDENNKVKTITKDKSKVKTDNSTKQKSGGGIPWYVWIIGLVAIILFVYFKFLI